VSKNKVYVVLKELVFFRMFCIMSVDFNKPSKVREDIKRTVDSS